MRQVTGLTSTYSSDEFGICSALYELGGMVVMHDASGCNSTYTTHDEPRWYDMDSMIYISAISETEAILGDDDKLIDDLIETAQELHPKFIALVGAPIPYMIGTDLEAIVQIVSRRTGIPGFAFAANGMHDYTVGVSMALEQIVRAYADRGTDETIVKSYTDLKSDGCIINIIGATPLDFSLNGSVASIQRWIGNHDMKNGICLSMGCSLEDVQMAGKAQVNLVVSAVGLAAAKVLRERFGTPYVVGTPFGEMFSESLADMVRNAAVSSENCIAYQMTEFHGNRMPGRNGMMQRAGTDTKKHLVIIGESVCCASLAAAIEMEYGIKVHVLCPLDTGSELLRPEDTYAPEEDDLMRLLETYDGVIADPLYRPLIHDGQEFYPLPHEAFSGRMYDSVNPNLIAVKLTMPDRSGESYPFVV